MKLLALGIAALMTFSACAPAAAQQSMCAAREQVVGMLESRYSETVRGRGLANESRVIEIWASDEAGTWTITMTMPNGMTCLMASGQHYETIVPEPEGDPT